MWLSLVYQFDLSTLCPWVNAQWHRGFSMKFAATRTYRTRAWRFAMACCALVLAWGLNAKSGGDPALASDVLVKLRTTAALDPLLSQHPLAFVSQFGTRPVYRLHVLAPANVEDVVDALEAEIDVLEAEPNFVHVSPEARRISVWAIGTPAAYTAQWAPESMRLSDAHRVTTGAGTRVAVLDTGIDHQHPMLAGRLLPGFDFVDRDDDPSEAGDEGNISFGHGTHVAGLVALAAPDAAIMPLRVLDAEGQTDAATIAEAMLFAIDPDGNSGTDDGAHVINLSLGSLSRTHVLDTIAKLATCALPMGVVEPDEDLADPGYNDDKDRCGNFEGAVIVAAAGNDATRSIRQYPAAEGAYGLMAVAASNADSRRADFSNYGSWVHIAAPGQGITSTVPGGRFAVWSGTSMAAPLVAGTAALVRSIEPTLSARDIARRIERNGTNLCRTKLSQVDAAAALGIQAPSETHCR